MVIVISFAIYIHQHLNNFARSHSFHYRSICACHLRIFVSLVCHVEMNSRPCPQHHAILVRMYPMHSRQSTNYSRFVHIVSESNEKKIFFLLLLLSRFQANVSREHVLINIDNIAIVSI